MNKVLEENEKSYITIKMNRQYHNICTLDLTKMYYYQKRQTPNLPLF